MATKIKNLKTQEGEERRIAKSPLLRQLIVICFALAFVEHVNGVSMPDFSQDIAPMIAKRCLECHNKRDVKGDVNLTTKVGFTKGTDGYCHFPIGQGYDEEYFEQLTAEKAVTRVRNGVKSRVCQKTRARN
jgi:hypothetical protein